VRVAQETCSRPGCIARRAAYASPPGCVAWAAASVPDVLTAPHKACHVHSLQHARRMCRRRAIFARGVSALITAQRSRQRTPAGMHMRATLMFPASHHPSRPPLALLPPGLFFCSCRRNTVSHMSRERGSPELARCCRSWSVDVLSGSLCSGAGENSRRRGLPAS